MYEKLALRLERYKGPCMVCTAIFFLLVVLSGALSSPNTVIGDFIGAFMTGFMLSWGVFLIIFWFHPDNGTMKNESLDKWSQYSRMPIWWPKVLMTMWFIIAPLLALLMK